MIIKPMKTSIALVALLAVFLAACGAASPTQIAGSTPTLFPTYAFNPPTLPPAIASLASSATAAATLAAPDPEKITLGMGRYVALRCGDCHVDAAQATSKGSPLPGTKLIHNHFINSFRPAAAAAA